jgi:hypothetical protein
MKKTFVYFLALMGLFTSMGCGDNKIGNPGNTNQSSSVKLDPKLVDLKVKMGWGRAEQYKLIGTMGYNSLFGFIRAEVLTNGNQTVIIHYSTDGINWFQVQGKNNGLTEDSNFTKFYFQTPELIADTNVISSIMYQFYVEYRTDTETYFSDESMIFKACTRPDQSLPDGVIGQAAPGYFHLILEDAKIIPLYNTNGIWVSNTFLGHIQVKNDPQNSDKVVKIIFRTNCSDWNQNTYLSYDFGLAQKLNKSFYSNGWRDGIEDWVFNITFPIGVTNIHFINSVTNLGTGVYWEDKNRCIRYWINHVPGIMVSCDTNFKQP